MTIKDIEQNFKKVFTGTESISYIGLEKLSQTWSICFSDNLTKNKLRIPFEFFSVSEVVKKIITNRKKGD